jgi:hypothetical protein
MGISKHKSKDGQFWKVINKGGKKKRFATPEDLWEEACEYFEWCDANPWVIRKTKTKADKGSEIEETPTQWPYTLTGLMLHLHVNDGYWYDFKDAKHEGYICRSHSPVWICVCSWLTW